MHILIAVASKHGSTREIAEAIADELSAWDILADIHSPSTVRSLVPYDAVILGSSIYAGNWLPEAKAFAAQFRAELAQLPVWVFSSGPLGADDPQPQHDRERLAASLARVTVRDHQIFVGKLDKSKLGLGERMIANVVRAPDGDFRDWGAIRAWASEIAVTLQPSVVVNS